MPRYRDDQCEECGAARVSGSRLCVGCLVKEREFLLKEVLIKQMVIEMRGKRIVNLEGLIKEATAYGFNKNQENMDLHRYIRKIKGETEREAEDGKDRQNGNT